MPMQQQEKIYRCTYPGEQSYVDCADSALILTDENRDIPSGYGLYLIDDENSITTPFPKLTRKMPVGCDEGSFVLLKKNGISEDLSLLATSDIPDRTLFITGQCNSNCLMCPYTEKFRIRAKHESLSRLLRYVALMNPFADYLCITGGEPTLLGEDFLTLMMAVREHFQSAMIHILTNGRTFVYRDFLQEYQRVRPYTTLLGIPVHASNAHLHDFITQAPGSFDETMKALDALYAGGEHIELRIVTSELNRENLLDLARLIAQRFPNVQHVCFMGLEMMGNAMIHRRNVWCDFQALWPYVRDAADCLIHSGVQVQLYNYPLCIVDHYLHPLYRKSITPSKIEYMEECASCRKKEICGGFFRTTKVMPGITVNPY